MEEAIFQSSDNIWAIGAGAIAIAFVHTVLGPDHFVPFVAMAKIGKWSRAKTIGVTLLCGIGHVGSSVALGMVAVVFGAAALKIKQLEGLRGNVAGWLLLAFGATYMTWGIRQAIRNRPHTHLHAHPDGTVHQHGHVHHGSHVHAHESNDAKAASITPWVLFTVFVFGPCEPMVPLVVSAAASGGRVRVVWVSLLFLLVTLVTMVSLVLMMCFGTTKLRWVRLQRFGHAIAGAIVLVCGLAVRFGL